MLTLDFETEAIVPGAPLLPKPVGFALRWPGGEAKYFAFGHPCENNCTWDEARAVLLSIWDEQLLTHNGATFDIPVAQHWFDLPAREAWKTEDTLFEAYLHDPHVPSLGLKQLVDRWLNIKNDEQNELHDWIVLNVPECRSRKQAGAYICRAPGGLVGKYAIADVQMTFALHEYLAPFVVELEEPYCRELRLAPVLVEAQNTGVRCDLPRLAEDTRAALKRLSTVDAAIRKELHVRELNLDSNGELVAALQKNGYNKFMVTPTGALSASKDSLEQALVGNPVLRNWLAERGTLATLTGTFMGPWVDMATRNEGARLHAQYNQVRSPDGFGTRTGRLSSSEPNFQNIPNEMGNLPVMRSYLLPDEGHVWTCGDFMSQEPRIAAHFEDGRLLAAFNETPTLDPYQFVKELVGDGVTRKEAKVIFLGLLYAMGADTLAVRLGATSHRATTLRNAIRLVLPDIVELDRNCKRRFQLGLPIRTLGGRIYFCEPPSNGRAWDYKALNTLIQGSAADQTKEALIFANKELKLLDPSIRILGTVHDEYSVSHPPEHSDKVREIMQLSTRALACDAPMLMTINSGPTWAQAAK